MASFPDRDRPAQLRRDIQKEFVGSRFRDLKGRVSSLFLRTHFLASEFEDQGFLSDEQKVKVYEKFINIEALMSLIKLLCSQYCLDHSQFTCTRPYVGAFAFIRGFVAEHDILDTFSIYRQSSTTSFSHFSSLLHSESPQEASVSEEEAQGELADRSAPLGCERRTPLCGPSVRSSRGRRCERACSACAQSPCLNKASPGKEASFVNTKSRNGLLSKLSETRVSTKRDHFFGKPCAKCGHEEHSWFFCREVTVAQRKRLARELGVCFVCLKFGHTALTCLADYQCVKCDGRHNVRLCAKPVTHSPAATTSREKKASSARSLSDGLISPSDDHCKFLQSIDADLFQDGISTDKGEGSQLHH